MNIKQVSEQPLSKIKVFNEVVLGKFFKNNELKTVEEKINLIAKWQDVKPLEVEKYTLETINKLVNGIGEIILQYKAEAPKTKIGNFTHRTNYKDFTAGHFKHIENTNPEDKPSTFLALLYIEDGLFYSHEETKGGQTIVINPTEQRAEEIEKQANLSDLIDLLTFFLNTSELLKKSWVLSLYKKIKVKK